MNNSPKQMSDEDWKEFLQRIENVKKIGSHGKPIILH